MFSSIRLQVLKAWLTVRLARCHLELLRRALRRADSEWAFACLRSIQQADSELGVLEGQLSMQFESTDPRGAFEELAGGGS